VPRILFTAETARIAGLKSVAVKKQRLLDNPPTDTLPLSPAIPTEDFVAARLSRVRAQLDKLDKMIEDEDDPILLSRLADAQSRLSVQEFALAGRPMPGNRRPAPERAMPERPTGAWLTPVIEVSPVPTVQQVSPPGDHPAA
jgi:hypothetical protein